MALTSSGRAAALYAVASSHPKWGMLSAAEQGSVQAQLQAMWGEADLSYLKSAAEILPGTMTDTSGAPVATAGSATAQTGTVTAASPILGKGVLS